MDDRVVPALGILGSGEDPFEDVRVEQLLVDEAVAADIAIGDRLDAGEGRNIAPPP